MRSRKTPALGALTVCAALLLSACGSSSNSSTSSTTSSAATPGQASAGETLTLYNGQHEQTTSLLVSAFEKQTHIKVKVRSNEETELGSQIEQEGSNSPADVFYTENTPVLEALREKNLLAPVSPSTLAAVPASYNSDQGLWLGISARASVLVYNTSQLKDAELPGSILELAAAKWKGKVGVAPGETDFQPLVTAVIKLRGAEAAETWLKGLKANGRIYPDNEAVVAQINNGESALAPINHYYWYRLRDEVSTSKLHSALHHYHQGDPGDLLNVSGAAVLKSSSHQAAAQAFLAFLVSQKGQEVITHSHSYEYPLRPGVKPSAVLPPFSSLHPTSLTPAELGDGSEALAMEQKLGLL